MQKALLEMQIAFRTELNDPERELYIEHLCSIRADIVALAARQLIETWKPNFGQTFPSIAEILEAGIQVAQQTPQAGRKFKSVDDIDPAKCPKGWTPEEVFRAHLTQEKFREEAHRPMPPDNYVPSPTAERETRSGEFQHIADAAPALLEELGQKVRVPHEQVMEWLEAGKEKQREYIAKLEADPQWQAMARRLGAFPGLHSKNPESEIPEDPVARKAWATRKAKEQGLI